MELPKREECLHNIVCKYDDAMCAADCGYYEYIYNPRLGCATTGELIEEIEARIDLNYRTIDN
jgi:hypothetical protein